MPAITSEMVGKIAIEIELKIPLVKRALKKFEEDNLFTLHDEKEES